MFGSEHSYDPVGEMGRAVQKATEGMSPEQKIAYIQQQRASGIAPQSVLWLMMKQQEELRQRQAKPPQMTVRDQLAAATAPQQPNPMQAGLGSINAGAMEQPQSFNTGGIVAFADGGQAGVDVKSMSNSQLEALAKSPNTGLAQLAVREYLRRTGYTDVGAKYAEAFRGGIEGPPAVRFSNERKFPDYMYDEQGNVKQAEGPKAGIAGLKESGLTRWVTPEASKEWNEAVTVPTADTPLSPIEEDMMRTATSGGPQGRFSIGAFKAKQAEKERQDAETKRQAAPTRAPATAAEAVGAEKAAPAMSEEDDLAKRVDMLKRMDAKLGIGKATQEYRDYLAQQGKEAEGQSAEDRRLALSQAGFAMAEAASRPAASFLGAAAVGGSDYAKSAAQIQKDMRANTRALRESQFRLAMADEQEARGNVRSAMQMRTQEQERQDRLKIHRDDLAARYAGLNATVNYQNAVLKMQQIVAAARNASSLRESRVKLATGLVTAQKDMANNPEYQELDMAVQKAKKDGDQKALDMAVAAKQRFTQQYLAPILEAQRSLGTDEGEDSGVISFDSLR